MDGWIEEATTGEAQDVRMALVAGEMELRDAVSRYGLDWVLWIVGIGERPDGQE